MNNPYVEYSPEHRVYELAQRQSGLTPEEVLEAAQYVPHDGTWLRDELLAQYQEQSQQADRTAEGIALHAADWAYAGMKSNLDTARAYGAHMEAMWRSGDMDVTTSHKTEYPAFLAAREAEVEQQQAYTESFTPSYAHGLLWASTEAVKDGEPTGETVYPEDWQTPAHGWQLDAFSPESRQQIQADSADFVSANWADLKDLDPEQSGHDFALSRNGHGAGFFDRGLGDQGDRLQEAAKVYGEATAWFDVSEHEDGRALVRLLNEPQPEEEQPEVEDAATADYLESLERDALDGPHFYDQPEMEAGL